MLPYCPILTRYSIVTELKNWTRGGAVGYSRSVSKHIKRAARREIKQIINDGLDEYDQQQVDELYRQWHGYYPNNEMDLKAVNDAIMEEINRDYSAYLYSLDNYRDQLEYERFEDSGIDSQSEAEDLSFYDAYDY